jgi:lysophospholipase L1-like esterase
MPYTDNAPRGRYRLEIDADGFIKPSRRHNHPDFSVVFLGGSTTECMYNEENLRFPYLVGLLLEQQTGKRVNSYNGGVSGNNSLHALDILLNKVVPLKPQVVVFMENINELAILLHEGTYWNQNPTRSPLENMQARQVMWESLVATIIPNLSRAWEGMHKALAEALNPNLVQARQGLRYALGSVLQAQPQDEFVTTRAGKKPVDQAALTRQFARNLDLFITMCRAYDITPVLMTQANRFTPRPDPVVAANVARFGSAMGLTYEQFKDLYDAFNDVIREAGRRNGVMVIDLAREIPSTREYLYDMVHFSETGSQRVAQIIAARLRGMAAAATATATVKEAAGTDAAGYPRP